ncbi:hypothetical protein JXA88_16585 [Candidatus Fermentibacteria bacterium]|nr:hypothetical protein [Candidatus Fermentibacteria bacterium]
MTQTIATSPTPWEDPIVTEVRRVRDRLFTEAGYDLETLCERIRKGEEAAGHSLVRRSPRSAGEMPEQTA